MAFRFSNDFGMPTPQEMIDVNVNVHVSVLQWLGYWVSSKKLLCLILVQYIKKQLQPPPPPPPQQQQQQQQQPQPQPQQQQQQQQQNNQDQKAPLDMPQNE